MIVPNNINHKGFMEFLSGFALIHESAWVSVSLLSGGEIAATIIFTVCNRPHSRAIVISISCLF